MKNTKHCSSCQSSTVVKKGFRSGKQRYLCTNCHKTWTSKSRPTRLIDKLWSDYTVKNDTVNILAERYCLSSRKIWQLLADYVVQFISPPPYPLPIIMDVTYFGKSWGILVVIDANTYAPIYVREVFGTEKTADYELAIAELQSAGFVVQAAVIDGRRGVREMLLSHDIPVQHYQFHQLMTIIRCLTRRPKLLANQELRYIALGLTTSTLEEFTKQLDSWHKKWGEWLKERTLDPENKHKRYTHERTRRAYFSLRHNLPYLFTCQSKELEELGIYLPNTSNALDGLFGAIKSKLKLHRGASKTLKTKMFFSFLSRRTGVGKHR